MKKTVLGLLVAGTMLSACNTSQNSTEVELVDELDSVSYALGTLISENTMSNFDQDIDIDIFLAAIRSHSTDTSAELLIPMDEANMIVQKYAYTKQQAKLMSEGQGNIDAGKTFLDANSTKEGVVTLPSGLQYKVIKEGSGAKPAANDQVKCHYTGSLIDGKVFDSSVERGEPATFGLNQVIRGWTEGVQLMSVGSKFEFYIPYDLAYGPEGRPPTIPPYSALVFEIELLEIVTGE